MHINLDDCNIEEKEKLLIANCSDVIFHSCDPIFPFQATNKNNCLFIFKQYIKLYNEPNFMYCFPHDVLGDNELIPGAYIKVYDEYLMQYNFMYNNYYCEFVTREKIKLIHDDGLYEGEWKNNKRHGYGKMIYFNGDIYEGEFKNDTQDGYGEMKYANGVRYKGHWSDDYRHGFGELVGLYSGIWVDDRCIKKKRNNFI